MAGGYGATPQMAYSYNNAGSPQMGTGTLSPNGSVTMNYPMGSFGNKTATFNPNEVQGVGNLYQRWLNDDIMHPGPGGAPSRRMAQMGPLGQGVMTTAGIPIPTQYKDMTGLYGTSAPFDMNSVLNKWYNVLPLINQGSAGAWGPYGTPTGNPTY